jgi:hypothetical protein
VDGLPTQMPLPMAREKIFKIRSLYDSIAMIRYPDIDLKHLEQIDEPH